MQEAARIWTQARHDVTNDFVDHVLSVGMKKAFLQTLQSDRSKKIKRKKSIVPTPQGDAYLQFFLTEFDGPGDRGNDEDDEEDDEESDDQDDESQEEGKHGRSNNRRTSTKIKQNVAGVPFVNPNTRQPSRYTSTNNNSVNKKKQYDPNDRKVKELIKRHEEVVKTMESEQQRRQQLVEKEKMKEREKKEREKKKEEEERMKKEKAKHDFHQRLEEERERQSKLINKLREEKKKKEEEKEKELKREKDEIKAMYREDWLLKGKMLTRPKSGTYRGANAAPTTKGNKSVGVIKTQKVSV